MSREMKYYCCNTKLHTNHTCIISETWYYDTEDKLNIDLWSTLFDYVDNTQRPMIVAGIEDLAEIYNLVQNISTSTILGQL